MEKSAPLSLVYLSLGSNQGERWELLSLAIRKIRDKIGSIASIARYIETEPWGFSSPHPFLNTAVAVYTPLTPLELLSRTQAIEQALGRRHKHLPHEAYQDRPIDIDILLYNQEIIDQGDQLQIPHPQMLKRLFVLEPLVSIAPTLVHPLAQQPIASLLSQAS